MGDSIAISDSELEVLKLLWRLGPSSVREIRSAMRRRRKQWAHTTILTLLRRLEDKGHVSVDRSVGTHVFSAATERDEMVNDSLDALADRLCDGEAIDLARALLQGRSFTAQERRALRQMVDKR